MAAIENMVSTPPIILLMTNGSSGSVFYFRCRDREHLARVLIRYQDILIWTDYGIV
jgi:hypothetical protein